MVATDAPRPSWSNPDNDWVECLTTEELKTLWEPAAEGKVTTWDQVNPTFPDRGVELYGPGTDSGTFDYFTEEINGEEGAQPHRLQRHRGRQRPRPGRRGDPNALGYFGYTYFEENADTLKAVEIDSGNGCVAPSAETAQGGSYTPLARPLFIYVEERCRRSKPQVKAFVDYYAPERRGHRRGGPVHPAQRRAAERAAGRAVDARLSRTRRQRASPSAIGTMHGECPSATSGALRPAAGPSRGPSRPAGAWSSCALLGLAAGLSIVITVGHRALAALSGDRVLPRGQRSSSSSPGPVDAAVRRPRASACCRWSPARCGRR